MSKTLFVILALFFVLVGNSTNTLYLPIVIKPEPEIISVDACHTFGQTGRICLHGSVIYDHVNVRCDPADPIQAAFTELHEAEYLHEDVDCSPYAPNYVVSNYAAADACIFGACYERHVLECLTYYTGETECSWWIEVLQ